MLGESKVRDWDSLISWGREDIIRRSQSDILRSARDRVMRDAMLKESKVEFSVESVKRVYEASQEIPQGVLNLAEGIIKSDARAGWSSSRVKFELFEAKWVKEKSTGIRILADHLRSIGFSVETDSVSLIVRGWA